VLLNPLKPRNPENCRYRSDVHREDDDEVATCRLLKSLLEVEDSRRCLVRQGACDACCRSFPPSVENLNPVIASLVYTATTELMDSDIETAGKRKKLSEIRESATSHMDYLSAEKKTAELSDQSPGNGSSIRDKDMTGNGAPKSLLQLLPIPQIRNGSAPRQWAVGVTTAPRRQATLEKCLQSLISSGWEQPHLFVDSPVTIPNRFLDLPITYRSEKTGAWPNYYLALVELLMKSPAADAYMIVQDDSFFAHQYNIREYLDDVLWPGKSPGVVSLYCSQADTNSHPGWFIKRGRWRWGALSFVFSRDLAKAFVADPMVLNHRWDRNGYGEMGVDVLIGRWSRRRRLKIWFPTPSLVQHIGESSVLWSTGRAQGSRRADWFVGEVDISTETESNNLPFAQ